jgi:hypothetical protein
MRRAWLRRTQRTKEFDMKKFGLIITLVLGITGASAMAAEHREDIRIGERHGGGRLENQIGRMNRMLSHVQWEVRKYGAGWRTRREVASISNEVSRINWRYRHNAFDHWPLLRQVERVRAELRNIEVRLHVRSRDFFRWD